MGIVVLEREAGRVEPGMAAGAGGLVAVLVELLADRRRAPDVGLDGGHQAVQPEKGRH